MDQPGYKSKLKQLQDNIKRSKLEHRELEYEFQKLIIQRSDCDRSAMKTFRNKYNSVLEEDKRRITRNEKIKQMLERIDYQASALAAKSDRLKMLKTHYEKNLCRAFGPNSSRTDNSSDRHTPKQRTKSVDAHTQIPRPNYEVFDMEDDLNNRNYVSSIREPRSVSTSRINQMNYNLAPNYDDQRSIRFNTDLSVNSEIPTNLEPSLESQAVNKGVRLFYGHELMNLPNLKVDNDTPVQDSKIADRILKKTEITFEQPQQVAALENTAGLTYTSTSPSKTIYQKNVDYRMYPNPQMVMKDLHNLEGISGFKNSRQYQEINNHKEDPGKQPPYPQQYLHNNNKISTNNNPSLNKPVEHTPQYQDNPPPKTPMQQAPYYQYETNKNTEDPMLHHSSPINSVENTQHLQDPPCNNQAPIQNQPVICAETISTLSDGASTENLEIVAQNNNRPQISVEREPVDGLESNKIQDNYQFTPNTIPEVKPISANQFEAAQINKPPSPKLHPTIIEAPNINIPQGIHQVWEKVVDVEIVNPPPKPYPNVSNEPRNDVIDKIYKEISSLGEIPANDEKDGILKPSEIDNRAEIIDKIEEHYYGEKIKSEEIETDIYSNTYLNDQNYEPQPDQSQIQAEQNIGYTTETQMYQDPNANYEISNPNYDINGQYYYSEQQDPGLSGVQDNYGSDPATNYNMEQPLNDPNYMYNQNESYQNYETNDGQIGYPVEQPDPQNYIIDENQQQAQQYTDNMQTQPHPNEQQYAENPNALDQEYSNNVYRNENVNYDQQNLNQEEYPVHYNENASEMYQDYSTDQQPQIESTIPYEYTDYIQNEQPAISDQNETPSVYDPEEISVNQAPSLLSVEQITSPIVETTKSPEEIKSDAAIASNPKSQTETKKKRVNFLDSSDSEQPSGEEKPIPKITGKDQSDSDFEFSVKSN